MAKNHFINLKIYIKIKNIIYYSIKIMNTLLYHKLKHI